MSKLRKLLGISSKRLDDWIFEMISIFNRYFRKGHLNIWNTLPTCPRAILIDEIRIPRWADQDLADQAVL